MDLMFEKNRAYNLEDGKVTRTYHERYIMVENGKLVFSLITIGLSILEYEMESDFQTFEVLELETKVVCWISMSISIINGNSDRRILASFYIFGENSFFDIGQQCHVFSLWEAAKLNRQGPAFFFLCDSAANAG